MWLEVQTTAEDARSVQQVIEAINDQLRERGCLGDRDAVEQSLSTSLNDAVAKLGGTVLVEDANGRIVVDFTGTGVVLSSESELP